MCCSFFTRWKIFSNRLVWKRDLLYNKDENFIKKFTREKTVPRALSFSPDGKYLLAGSYGGALSNICYLYHFPSGKIRVAFKEHKNIVMAVSATVRNGEILLATGDGDAMEILLWDEEGRVLSRIESAGTAVYSSAITSDGKK